MLRSELSLKEVKSVENCGEGKNVKILVEGGGRVKTPFRCVCSFDFSNCHQWTLLQKKKFVKTMIKTKWNHSDIRCWSRKALDLAIFAGALSHCDLFSNWAFLSILTDKYSFWQYDIDYPSQMSSVLPRKWSPSQPLFGFVTMGERLLRDGT